MEKKITVAAILAVASVATLAATLQPFGGDLAIPQGTEERNGLEDTHNDTGNADSQCPTCKPML